MMSDFTITDAGLLRFVSIVIRSWLSVQAAILLVAVTRFPDLIHAFEHLRVPAILTTIIAFLYRYLFVLTDEVMRLLRARQSRSAARAGQRSGGGVLWRARVSGHMAGQLFLRSYERSDRIYNAMLARGYAGQLRTLNAHELHRRDWAYGAAAFLFILAATCGTVLMPITHASKNFHIPNVKAMRRKCAIYISLIPMDILRCMVFHLNCARAIRLRWWVRTVRASPR
ncbi:energy-coupling factor transporter transmembrane component T [Candidatus Villigracilis saccharophilus]|uniref:energy-coupling factor transporter transmembrane component T n=1 Tax=Candidatus Villigracilis saccharophilus TaxID=3140684 RepID=UPI0031EC1090